MTIITWEPCWRIIKSIPNQFEILRRVDRPDGIIERITQTEYLTKRESPGEEEGILDAPPDGRIAGACSAIVEAAFANRSPGRGRFSGKNYGVFYAAGDLKTAMAETSHHYELRMRREQHTYMALDMQVYMYDLNGDFHDLRGQRATQLQVYHNSNYGAARRLAKRQRKNGSDGIAYDSVRRKGGECVAVFNPRLPSNERREQRLRYVWNGEQTRVEPV